MLNGNFIGLVMSRNKTTRVSLVSFHALVFVGIIEHNPYALFKCGGLVADADSAWAVPGYEEREVVAHDATVWPSMWG